MYIFNVQSSFPGVHKTFIRSKKFKEVLQLPLPKNILSWKKFELTNAFDLLDISKNSENGKPMTVSLMKKKLLSHTISNVSDKQKLNEFSSEGEKPHKIEYSLVQKTV